MASCRPIEAGGTIITKISQITPVAICIQPARRRLGEPAREASSRTIATIGNMNNAHTPVRHANTHRTCVTMSILRAARTEPACPVQICQVPRYWTASQRVQAVASLGNSVRHAGQRCLMLDYPRLSIVVTTV